MSISRGVVQGKASLCMKGSCLQAESWCAGGAQPRMEPFGCCGVQDYGSAAPTVEREGCGRPRAGQGEQMEVCEAGSEWAEGMEVKALKTKQKVRGGKTGSRKKSRNSSTGKARGGGSVEVAGGRPWMGVFCAVKSSGVCRFASWRY